MSSKLKKKSVFNQNCKHQTNSTHIYSAAAHRMSPKLHEQRSDEDKKKAEENRCLLEKKINKNKSLPLKVLTISLKYTSDPS